MRYPSIWIGDPFDPDFDWRGKDRVQAPSPRPVSAPLPAPERLWRLLGPRFAEGQLGARRASDGAWIGVVSRRELMALLDEAFPGNSSTDVDEARRSVAALDPRTMYYLVAAEWGPSPDER